jgi:T5SS/PEP-CTERM-associated repeat protein
MAKLSGPVIFSILIAASVPFVAPAGPVPEVVITEPVDVAHYSDAVVITLDGIDLMREAYSPLRLEYRIIRGDGTTGPRQTVDLTASWEKPSIILEKAGGETFQSILITLRDNASVFLSRIYELGPEITPQTVIPVLGQTAAIEPGQFMGTAPTIPLPDLPQLAAFTDTSASRTVDVDSVTYPVHSDISFPLISANNNAALTRQTDHPADDTKRSIYVPLKSQLYDPLSGNPTQIAHYLAEVPLDEAWMTGSEDLIVNLGPDDIKVHKTDEIYTGSLGGTGTVIVRDPGSLIDLTSQVKNFYVGWGGAAAHLFVTNGARLACGNFYMNHHEGPLGKAATATIGGGTGESLVEATGALIFNTVGGHFANGTSECIIRENGRLKNRSIVIWYPGTTLTLEGGILDLDNGRDILLYGTLRGSGTVWGVRSSTENTGFRVRKNGSNIATVSPGTPAAPIGHLAFDEADVLEVHPDCRLEFELGGTGTNQYDRVTAGQAKIFLGAYSPPFFNEGGTVINVGLANGFAPSPGDTFDLLVGQDIVNTNLNLLNFNLPAGVSWTPSVETVSGKEVLRLTALAP